MKLFKFSFFLMVLLCIATTVLSINANAPMPGHHGQSVPCRGGGRRGPWWANGGNGNGNSTGDGDANAGGATVTPPK